MGQVSPGTELAPLASRGMRPNSDAQSSLPRSAIRLRVLFVVRDDDFGVERGRAQHAHRVVVREHQVAHRLVGVLSQFREPVPRCDRRRERLEADEEVLQWL